MATTTNYGWTTPNDTALVKDGAAAIRSLGSAIDTSLNTALGTKKAGLVLLNTTTFTNVASQSINNVFTSAYDNYRIYFIGIATGGLNAFRFRLRVSGTDATGSNYNQQRLSASSTTVAGLRQTGLSSGVFGIVKDDNSQVVVDISRPFLASATNFIGLSIPGVDTNLELFNYVGSHTLATSYDGFSVFPDAGNITGTIRVYGYAN